MKNAERKPEKQKAVFLTAASAGLLSEHWNFSSVGTGISSERKTDGFTSRHYTETMSGKEENTAEAQRALKGKLRITQHLPEPRLTSSTQSHKERRAYIKLKNELTQIQTIHSHTLATVRVSDISDIPLCALQLQPSLLVPPVLTLFMSHEITKTQQKHKNHQVFIQFDLDYFTAV